MTLKTKLRPEYWFASRIVPMRKKKETVARSGGQCEWSHSAPFGQTSLVNISVMHHMAFNTLPSINPITLGLIARPFSLNWPVFCFRHAGISWMRTNIVCRRRHDKSRWQNRRAKSVQEEHEPSLLGLFDGVVLFVMCVPKAMANLW